VPLKIVQRCFGFPGPDDATMLAWSRATQADMFHNLTNNAAMLQADIAAGQRRASEALRSAWRGKPPGEFRFM